MIQPAPPGPFPQQAGDPHNGAEPLPDSPTRQPPRAPGWWWAAIGAAGIPVGLLWWVLAPSGLNLLSGNPGPAGGSSVSAVLPRDLVLAGLFLLAGCITGVLVSGNRPDGPSVRSVALAVASAAAGALIAWGTGVLAAAWWGPVPDSSGPASIAFSLQSYQLLAIWPAAAALAIFLRFAVKKPAPAPDAGPGYRQPPGAGPAPQRPEAGPGHVK